MTTTETPSYLAGWASSDDTPEQSAERLGVRQRTFGRLVDLAHDIVEHYRSDFYHDAQWLEKHLVGPMTFYYGADSYGTAIGTDRDLVAQMREKVWRIDIGFDNREWTFLATPEESTK